MNAGSGAEWSRRSIGSPGWRDGVHMGPIVWDGYPGRLERTVRIAEQSCSVAIINSPSGVAVDARCADPGHVITRMERAAFVAIATTLFRAALEREWQRQYPEHYQ